MPEPSPTLPAATALVCGSCGAPVAAADVTCPACGVLLAAYRPAIGSLPATEVVDDTSATREIASPTMTATAGPAAPASTAAPAVHRPVSQSPIGDALRRGRFDHTLPDAHDRTGEAHAAALADMADGIDELADMADGVDELSTMADGTDELAEMAAAGNTPLAREVEAQLAGAKVTFEGAKPVITTEPAPVSPAASAPPTPVATPVPPRPVTRPARTTTQTTQGRLPVGASPPITTPKRSGPAGGVVLALILVLFFSIVLRWPVLGSMSGIFLGIGVVYVLVKLASLSSRKTTTMPWDRSWNDRNRR